MLIHAYRRTEPVTIDLFGALLKFELNDVGHAVCEVTHGPSVDRLLSIAEAYRGYGPDADVAVSAPVVQAATLIGSSALAAEIELVEDRFVALADVVQAAFERSGLDLPGWNALATDDREALLAAEVAHLRAVLKAPDDDEPEEETPAVPGGDALVVGLAAAADSAVPPVVYVVDVAAADSAISLVLTNGAETIDLATYSAKQVREFAAANGVELPKGNSTPLATLRVMLAKALQG